MTEPRFNADFRLWPAIAHALPKPWPVEAVGMDLQWWEDQVRRGSVARVPGRCTMAERWGWTEKRVRRKLEEVRHD